MKFLSIILLGLALSSMPAASRSESVSLDIDGDGQATALTDGLLIIRYLFGFSGTALVAGALGSDAAVTTADAIVARLDSRKAAFDIDGDGSTLPLTDGLLIIRYLFGFQGSALVAGAVGDSAVRTDATTLVNFLDALESGTSDGSGQEAQVTAEDYFKATVSEILLANCLSCHNANGIAKSTRLVYVDEAGSQQNYETLRGFIAEGNGALLLNKIRGVDHGGRTVFTQSAPEYEIFRSFVERVEVDAGLSGSTVKTPIATDGFFKGTRLTSSAETLRRAAILMLGRNPTETEYAQLDGDDEAALKIGLRGLTRDPGFHNFLARSANDRLLTDAFLEGQPIDQSQLEGPGFYPMGNQAFIAEQAEAGERFFDWPKYRHWQWGLARSAVELIAYIVENDRNYQEVVTADYMMMNYAVNDFLNGGGEFELSDPEQISYCQKFPDAPCIDHRQFKPGQNRGQIIFDEFLTSEDTEFQTSLVTGHSEFIEYPHAGVLNTPAFLHRYPSTETNRNRARARWTFYHFLGVDIEKSAPRSTEPAALSDGDNPTMRNPACTVCHQILDPVAGSFQLYGDNGLLNESWGGKDALPDNYKQGLRDPVSRGLLLAADFDIANTDFETLPAVTADFKAGTVFIELSFINDFYDEDTQGDRNAKFKSLTIEGPESFALTIDFESRAEEATLFHGCPWVNEGSLTLGCNGRITIPFAVSIAGEYSFQLTAAGDQAGEEPVKVLLIVDREQGYEDGDTWYSDMRKPGFMTDEAPPEGSSLQWLGRQIAEDAWFASAAIKFWWPAVMGSEVAQAPEVTTDADFETRLAVFEAQKDFIDTLASDFKAGLNSAAAYNGRELIIELMASPWFRVNGADGNQNPQLAEIGTRRLLTPEELDLKFYNLAGYYWGWSPDDFSEHDYHARAAKLSREYKVLYGGIDSRNVTQRASTTTAMMFNIAEKMALDTACELVAREFEDGPEKRRLFSEVEIGDSPMTRSAATGEFSVPNSDFDRTYDLAASLIQGEHTISISFLNDWGDADGDRNARIDRIEVIAPDGSRSVFEAEALPAGSTIDGCGHQTADYYQLSCSGSIQIPWSVTVTGDYLIKLSAAGEQYGPDPVKIGLALTAALPNTQNKKIKQQLRALHQQLLGETLALDDPELAYSYELVEEAFEYRSTLDNPNLNQWPAQQCNNQNWRHSHFDTSDSTRMKGVWMTLLTYFMTDFRFLHE
ncbi:DUF1588 domain-containing protein [Pseudomonadales bacterium]|nr:DUF1588 domain-containing protein [Pseudomonadales bacterium]